MTEITSSQMPVKILIAEDSPIQAHILRILLQEQGYEVTVADNGKSALDMAAEIKPSLIISDVNMPEMNGFELTAQIKSSPELQRIPVILVTSMSQSEDVISGINCGADSFVLKPYEKNYLLDSVAQVLANVDSAAPHQAPTGVEINFKGRRHHINAHPTNTVSLLLSVYEATVQRNRQLVESQLALQRRTSESINTSRFLDSIIESVPNPIFIKDATTLRYTRINEALEKLIGISRSEMIGMSDYDFIPQEMADASTARDRELLRSRVLCETHDEPIQTRDKGQRLLHTKRVAVINEHGEPSHLLGISEDVTLQRESEGLIRKLNDSLSENVEKLKASNKDLESFSYSVSHDLRSPLAVMGGYVGLLKKHCAKQLDEKSIQYFDVISRNINHMSNLIDDLLAFSKSASHVVKKSEVDMHLMVREIVDNALQQYPEDQIPPLKIEVASLPPALADKALLHQVWVNLISNAIKYSGKSANPRIEVIGQREGSEIIYSVRDNGAGFDMTQYDKLFGIFQRLHGSNEFEGTGIGLAIVNRIVKSHGGRVWAESEINEGAVFYFALPA